MQGRALERDVSARARGLAVDARAIRAVDARGICTVNARTIRAVNVRAVRAVDVRAIIPELDRRVSCPQEGVCSLPDQHDHVPRSLRGGGIWDTGIWSFVTPYTQRLF